MNSAFNKLWRNRFTLLALPAALIVIVFALSVLFALNFDLNAFINFMFVFVLFFLVGMLVWRMKFPISFWNVYVFAEPYNALFHANRGSAYLRRCDYERALQDYTIGLQLRPKAKSLAALHNGRMVLFLQMGRYREALQDAASGVQAGSTGLISAAVICNRGSIYQKLFMYDLALQDYAWIIQTNQRLTAVAFLSRGLIYAAQGNPLFALQDADASVQRRPRFPATYLSRATIHLKFRQYQRALDDANLALTHCKPAVRLSTRRGGNYPYASTVYAHRALAHCGLQNYQAALDDARQAVALAPVYAPNFYALGQTYLAMNAVDQAHQAFFQGFDTDPHEVSNAVLLTWTDMCIGEPTIAQAKFLADAANNYPESEWGHLCRGISAWLYKDYTNARSYLTHAQQLDVTNPHCYFWLAMLHASVEEDELAMSALQRAEQSGLARLLFAPLRYFEQQRPEFYQLRLRSQVMS